MASLARHAAEHDPRVQAEIGLVSLERKRELFAQASIVVLPYTSFASQSGVLHDAYGHGRPVVVTDVGALGRSVREDGTGLVAPPGEAAELAVCITQALEPSNWQRFSVSRDEGPGRQVAATHRREAPPRVRPGSRSELTRDKYTSPDYQREPSSLGAVVVKHSRSDAFESALEAEPPSGPTRWSDIASDPNDPRVLAQRARTLRAAWREAVEDRAEFVVDRCVGQRVLDIGCVAHDVERMQSLLWLHRRIAAAAAACLGVDVLDEGIDAMRDAGFDAVAHDLSEGPGPVAPFGPFDVIVAGELIEHVPALDMLFSAARDLLARDGQLIITTPNPWAPHRVVAGQRGDCWENVDHIMFAFPSGIAELAERHGLVLAEAMTTTPGRNRPDGPAALARSARRRLRGRGWTRAGFATRGRERVVRMAAGRTSQRIRGPRGAPFVGETFVYVVRRASEDG